MNRMKLQIEIYIFGLPSRPTTTSSCSSIMYYAQPPASMLNTVKHFQGGEMMVKVYKIYRNAIKICRNAIFWDTFASNV